MTTTDPIQALIDAGAIPSEPFGPDSRYAGVPLAVYRRKPDDEGTPFVRRRFIPPRRDVTVMVEHMCAAVTGPTCWRDWSSAMPSSTGALQTPTP